MLILRGKNGIWPRIWLVMEYRKHNRVLQAGVMEFCVFSGLGFLIMERSTLVPRMAGLSWTLTKGQVSGESNKAID